MCYYRQLVYPSIRFTAVSVAEGAPVKSSSMVGRSGGLFLQLIVASSIVLMPVIGWLCNASQRLQCDWLVR